MRRVLVIEDEPLIAAFIAGLAERAGAHKIDTAASEIQALAAALSAKPDLILADVNLRQGGSGPAAVAAIQCALGEIPVIYITASPEETCGRALAVLIKPVSPSAVIRAVEQAMQEMEIVPPTIIVSQLAIRECSPMRL